MSATILALDTSTEACSVALSHHDKIIQRYEIAPRQHSQLILPMIESVLSEAGLSFSQLNAIAFGRGPGSFTGVRLATSVTKGIAFAHKLPVIPVSTLQALAYAAHREFPNNIILTAIDARMNEVYWALYQTHEHLLHPETVCAPADVTLDKIDDIIGVGSGWDTYHEIFEKKAGKALKKWLPQAYPKASDILELAAIAYAQGKIVSAELALPVYLRDEVTHG